MIELEWEKWTRIYNIFFIFLFPTFVVRHETKIKLIINIKSVLLSQQDLEGRKHLH